MEWDYHREKAGNDWENLRTVPQLMMVLLPAVDDKEPPIQDVRLLGARKITSTSELKLPEGWSAELPEAIHAKSEFGTYDLTFRYREGSLFADRQWSLTKTEVPKANWKLYKAWTDAISLGNEPYVQLRRARGEKAAASEGASSTKAFDAEAARLIAQANTAVEAGQMGQAAKLLDEAKAKNPEQLGLWGEYGWMSFRSGNQNEAMRLYRKELDIHPENGWAYRNLGFVELATGDKAGSLATINKWAAQLPEDSDAAKALIQMQLSMNQAAAAAKEADAALLRLPEEARGQPALQLLVGEAQLRGGEAAKGVATLTALMGASTDPLILNDAAYELADQHQALPTAETSERQVLAKLSEETSTWTLDEAPATLLGKSALLTASWDTMGWILYREGKLNEAEPYLRAAWLSRASLVVGRHLGDAQFAQGHKAEALATYRLARATADDRDMMGVRTAPSPEALALDARIAELSVHASAASDKAVSPERMQANGALQKLRTIPLQASLGHDGTAEYKLLLSPVGVKRAEPTEASALAGGAELLAKAKLP